MTRARVEPPSEDVRAELARAFGALRPHFRQIADVNARLDPESPVDALSDAELEQFINAYEALFLEALEGRGREVRDVVFDTALEPIIEAGRTALGMVRSSVVSAVSLTHRLLPLVREDLRDDAALWLAAYLSDFSHEQVERALAIEAGR